MKKNIIYGHLTILAAMTFAVLGTLLYEWICTFVKDHTSFDIIFSTGSVIMGVASIMTAIWYYTNNLGNGFKKN
jgi:hypothetical protein